MNLQSRILDLISGRAGDFEDLVMEVFAFQRARNSIYRAFCDQQPAVTHWKQIPAVPTSAFKEFPITCFPVEEAVAVFHTSGTTSEKAGKHYFKTLELYDAATRPNFEAHLQPRDSPAFVLGPSPKDASHSSLAYMMGVVAPHGEYFPMDYAALARRLCEVDQPVLLLGTAFAFVNFFDHTRPLKLVAGSRAMETGGFKGRSREVSKPELYRLFREQLGIELVVNEYGMTELSTQFYDGTLVIGRQTDRKRPPPWARVMVIDPRTGREAAIGERGLLRIFDLANLWSAAVIQTEDIGVAHDDGTFEILGRAAGAEVRGCSLDAESLRVQASSENR
jgi:acyl-coenzyme A synthetase/AMP-(fatty) acid ligase